MAKRLFMFVRIFLVPTLMISHQIENTWQTQSNQIWADDQIQMIFEKNFISFEAWAQQKRQLESLTKHENPKTA